MKCPYCNHSFPLTWSRYLKSPFGRHTCPDCKRNSRLEFRLLHFLVLTAVMTVVTIPCVLMLYRGPGGYWPLLGFVPGALAGLMLDKTLDEKYRRLIPLKNGADKAA